MTGISESGFKFPDWRYRKEAGCGYAAMPCLGTTVTVQRMGLLDLTSITERTIPDTGIPFNTTVAFWPRYWAKRQRRASIGSVISIACMHHQRSRYAKQFRDNLHDIEQPLIMTPNRALRPGQSSQRTQVIRHDAELSQHGRAVEIAGRRITGAAERDRTGMAQYFPKTLRTFYRGCGAWTFYGFTNNYVAVRNIEWQRHEICNSGHGSPT
jgi:hypothetical protein